ncbi:SusC/RagA family TonB-linked outer membrane protein [Flammeovirga agarivorans]|uniref:TonB-dependent receptor n=1 Tax=Flammeovirga agarivorans TaxID=2726742 RepID=A0A7X8SQ54_9BACT|nr:TonB-dependent receptor [Flammeovirga agarivorans]NLR94332.1 TonB-dependent receptor [Flammeovirga agarivorans]
MKLNFTHLSNKSLRLLMVIGLFMCSLSSYAQNRIIKGHVTDETGSGTPGVNIVITGTTIGTVTDISGNFALEVANGNTIEFRYIGYVTQTLEVVASRDEYNVQLQVDAQELEEIVVVGYGVQKKSDLSSAVSTVKADEANKIAAASSASMLQGRTSGVSVINGGAPGTTPYIKIRGMSSFGDVQPLFVIDGIPGGDISMINPDDIASFEILKDGAAAAIYGSLAANGVVLVTTKSGKKNQKMKIDFNMYSGIQKATNQLPMANSEEWYSIMNQSYNNSIADGSLAESAKPAYLQAGSGFDLNNYANTDWQNETLQTGIIQNYSLGMSGGGESSNYNFSMNYFNQDGVVINTGTERYNFRYKSTFEKGNLKISPNIIYTHTVTDNNTMSMSNMQKALPLVAVNDPSKESGYGYINEYDIRSGANPVGQSEIINSQDTKDQLQANLGLNYQFSDHFFAMGNLGYTKNFFQNRYYAPAYVLASDTQRQDPYLSEYRSDWSDLNYDFTLNYMNTFGKHSVSAMAGIVGYKYDYQNIDMNVTGGAMFPDFGGLNPSFGGMASGDFIGAGGFQTVTRFSYMTRLNYSYDDRYLVQATVRTDGSSKFGENNRWGTFPSVSAAWKIHNEEFFGGMTDIFSELKLRGSYGILGRETTLDAYSRQALVENGFWYVWGGQPVGGIGSFEMANPDLAWEQSKTMNIGLDFGLLEDKIYGTFNYYENNSESLLMEEPNTPPSSGVEPPIVNLGTISNRGIEIELGYRGAVGDFKYDVKGNITTIKNEVVSLGGSDAMLPGNDIAYTGAQTFSAVGASASQFYMYKTNGIFQTQEQIDNYVGPEGTPIQPNAQPGDVIYVDVNGDGMIDSQDITDVGSPLPTLEYGLNLGFSYKGWDMSMFFQGVSGNKILNVNRYEMEAANNGFNVSSDLMNAWTPTNTNTDIPRNVQVDNNNNYMMSDRFLEDGSYFRLKNIQIGYSLPKSTLAKMKVEKLRIYVNADNLFTITDYSGYDPEIVPTDALTQGVDYGNYPMYQTFTAGVQVTF